MSADKGRIKLIHAARWLNCERDMPVWAQPGVYFALRLLDNAKATFYVYGPHKTTRCQRCGEIAAVALFSKPTEPAEVSHVPRGTYDSSMLSEADARQLAEWSDEIGGAA